jgi:hypothetical protein
MIRYRSLLRPSRHYGSLASLPFLDMFSFCLLPSSFCLSERHAFRFRP